MKTFNLYATILLIASCTFFIACSKDDEPKQDSNHSIEKYYSWIYGSWYREYKSETSHYFMSYIFYTNKTLATYFKSAKRVGTTSEGNSIWKVENEYRRTGTWQIEEQGGLNYLTRTLDSIGHSIRTRIVYISPSLLNFEDGYTSDLNKGDKNPNF